MSDSEQIDRLAARYLAACDKVFVAALEASDRVTARNIAKSALSVALDSAKAFDMPSSREQAITWYERLSSLYLNKAGTDEEIGQVLRWASSSMDKMFNRLNPINEDQQTDDVK
jgi:precorrin-2 methylase